MDNKQHFTNKNQRNAVDGRNPADQLRLVVYPIIYRVLDIPGGERRISEPSNPKQSFKPSSSHSLM